MKTEIDKIIDFAEWYSGMERIKVIRAYKRYCKEVLKIKDSIPVDTEECDDM